MGQLNYILLFRWFVGLSVDDPVWVSTVSSKNRDRPHFSVNGTLIWAWASMKSFRRTDGNDETHASTTDPDARLTRKFSGEEPNRPSPGIYSSKTATVLWSTHV